MPEGTTSDPVPQGLQVKTLLSAKAVVAENTNAPGI
jgi:hypothetical protein